MKNKIVLVTGGTSGIGRAASHAFARQGARLVFTYRDRQKGEEVLREIRQKTGNREVQMLELDLASLESVRQSADAFRQKYDRLDVLINNAGGYFGHRKSTAEGFEYTFGVNHLGHFLFTNLLKDRLVKGTARIINVSSQAQRVGHIRFDDLMLEKKYLGFRAYAQAKLANIIFTYELSRRWAESGVTANAMHPGAVNTNFGYDARPVFKFLLRIGKPFLKSPERGAATLVYLASSLGVEGITGKYFARRRQIRSNRESYEHEIWKKLWEVSEALTGLSPGKTGP
jgi:retinol dehydrogenase-14